MYACEGHIPELAGERVLLRRLTEEDAPDMLRCWSDPDTRRFIELPPMQADADAAALIAWLNGLSEEEETLRWGIELAGSGRVIGSCGLNQWQLAGAYRGEFGCELASDCQGQGYMSEAAGLAMRFAFQEMGLNRIEAFVQPGNDRALRLFERLGYAREGVLREYRHTSAGYVDAVVFSMLKRDWSYRKGEVG
ncbi:GNAT family N-acetyltransferase [Paenibacillus ihbetae]|uniref:GNAT family N-acetyltransferase n=1 Tax=Paenibacillus ihbetae TaxID=1870820 RepID=A0A1B2DZ38_9BACL|nr:GNAT family protein [Paenibacillus ihbetae]ANY73016.1 GNAT family N-acetyltransferase [Paenibacillus ihbetae]